jgi:UPF0755 protein
MDRPRRQLSPLLRLINATLTFTVVIALALGAGLAWIVNGFDAVGPLDEAKVVAIPRNDGTLTIAERLERERVIDDKNRFLISYWLMARYAAWNGGKPIQIKAGEYEFKPGASVRSVVDTLSEGRSVLTRVTIPEGLTSIAIVERLRADASLTGDLREVPPEGSLLPETYSVPRGTSRQTVIELMQAAQKKLLEQLWAERQDGLPLKTPQEALVMASIVEKETGRNDERERVAAVFINRMRQSPPMRLQSDPTILYGLFQGRVQWGKPILASEIRSNTAHNTYAIPGLPPTPICNPGRAALEATLRPGSSRDLYFVADGKGGHIFAETLKDHNANVARWRAIEREREAQKAQPTPSVAPSGAPTVQPATINAPRGAATAAPPAAGGATKAKPQ